MSKSIFKTTLLALAAPVILSSCASIVGKSSYPVTIQSNPKGADINITDKKGAEVYKGTTPAIVTLKAKTGYFSKAQYDVKISTVGYADQTVPVTFKLNAMYFGNLLFGGVIGMLVVDPLTGAMWKIVDPVVDVTLKKKTTAMIQNPTLQIIDIATLSLEMKEKLVKIN